MEEQALNVLARRFRDSDMRSFKKIVDSLTESLMALAYRYTRDWESARDLCQDTWLRVYEKIGAYDPARPFSTWLYTIHRNGCLSYIRRASFQREVPAGGAVPEPGTGAADCPDPHREIEKREFARRLREAMKDLTDRQLEVFTRVDIEQQDRDAAARELGMNAATLRTTLHFARRRLAERLRKMESDHAL